MRFESVWGNSATCKGRLFQADLDFAIFFWAIPTTNPGIDPILAPANRPAVELSPHTAPKAVPPSRNMSIFYNEPHSVIIEFISSQ